MIADSLVKGGKERRMLELLRYIDESNKYKVELIILKSKIDYNVIYELKNTRLIVIKRKIKKDPFVFYQVWKYSKEFKPNLIHVWGSMPAIYSLPIVLFSGVPLLNSMIANAKCDIFTKDWFRAKFLFPFSTIILANSHSGIEAFKVKSKKARVIHNGFNFDRLKNLKDSATIRKEYSVKTKYVVGMVAAFHPRKDYETYLEVSEEFCKERDDITFLAVGDGINKTILMDRYKSTSNIIFTGNVTDVEQLISIFDIGILLSNTNKHLEGISNSILEMMALGKPVIATRGGGTDEIIQHNICGVLIDPLNKVQLKQGLQLLIDNSVMRLQIGRSAKKKIETDFSIQQMCSKTAEIYKNILIQ